jgi:hypothetical protein
MPDEIQTYSTNAGDDSAVDVIVDGGNAAFDGAVAAPAPVLAEPPPIVLTSTQEANTYFADNIVALHKALTVFAPIVGVSGAGDDMRAYIITFGIDATEEQKTAAFTFLQNWPAHKAKARIAEFNLQALASWFEEQTAEGCALSAGYRLGLKPDDVALLTGNYVLAQTADSLGLPLPDVIDKDGVPHRIESLAVLTQLMLEYGQYRAGLSAVYAAKKAAISHALAELAANS